MVLIFQIFHENARTVKTVKQHLGEILALLNIEYEIQQLGISKSFSDIFGQSFRPTLRESSLDSAMP